MARMGNVEYEQVRKWFINKRASVQKQTADSVVPFLLAKEATEAANGNAEEISPVEIRPTSEERELPEYERSFLTDHQINSLPKAPEPYINMIAKSLLNAPGLGLKVTEIYESICTMYPQMLTQGGKSWKSAVRHSLSVNEFFVKHADMGRGMATYTVHPAVVETFLGGDFRRRNARLLVRRYNQEYKMSEETMKFIMN